MIPVPTPECDKLVEPAASEAGAILAFLEWLNTQRKPIVSLAIGGQYDRLMPLMVFPEALVYEYLGVDPIALERERRAILEELLP